MDIFGDVLGFIKNPIGGVIGGAVSLAVYQGYKFIKSRLKPVDYINKLFDGIDDVIRHVDNQFVDKIGNKRIRSDVQKEIDQALNRRIGRLQALRKEIAD